MRSLYIKIPKFSIPKIICENLNILIIYRNIEVKEYEDLRGDIQGGVGKSG